MSTRVFHWPVAAATFAGLLGAAVVDAALTLARAGGGLGVVALAVGLYGAAGLALAVALGCATAVVLGAIPGGAAGLRDEEALDVRVAGTLLAGTAGAAVVAAGSAASQALFVAHMASHRLAVIATFGLTLALCPVGVVGALACRRMAAAVARALPRPARLGRTGLLLAAFVAGGVLLGVAALSRADWRVLDLGPLEALAVAALLGAAHGVFWYLGAPGRALHARLPRGAIRAGAVALVVAMVAIGARLPESAPAFQAVTDGALGLRLGVKIARALTDRDGDGFSARFGGGDCDDTRADTYPGAEDVPGDGIDQNCEGGDARVTVEAPAPAALRATAPRAAGGWNGNLLVISIDALRGDRLGVAGYQRAGASLTPTLDALAKRGAYFRRVWSQAPNTPRSFPSLLTSRYPSEIAWQQRSLNYSPILPANETFFEPLARAGWRPIGIFSHFYFTADRGISQGFAEWSNDGAGSIAESNKDVAAPRIVPRVVARLERAAKTGERFALWTHLFEPHSSYMEHPEFPAREHGGVAALEEKYDYEIAFADRWIGKIVATLDATGLSKKTAIVVIADHGEAWGEHKRYFHGQDLTEEQLRVPLIVAVPGRAPVVVDQEVALVDVGPTVLDLCGLAIPPVFHGRSLLPLIEGKALPPHPVFAELLPATAWPKHEVMMVDRGRKIVHRVTDRRFDLYDLTDDPKQQRNLADDPGHHALLEELRARLLAFEEGKR